MDTLLMRRGMLGTLITMALVTASISLGAGMGVAASLAVRWIWG